MANYVAPIMAKLTDLLPDCEPELVRFYALLILIRGVNADERDVHDAWAVWRDMTNPGHRSLVPFDELTAQVQALDVPYAQAIRKVAEEVWGAGPNP